MGIKLFECPECGVFLQEGNNVNDLAYHGCIPTNRDGTVMSAEELIIEAARKVDLTPREAAIALARKAMQDAKGKDLSGAIEALAAVVKAEGGSQTTHDESLKAFIANEVQHGQETQGGVDAEDLRRPRPSDRGGQGESSASG